ncbi:MAG TPA: heavy-metal-associated domain-containing protein [Phycisphaerae bacterium]|nr:heavy-metal-associated domain-containing protein [Phycisphaerae bacterium]
MIPRNTIILTVALLSAMSACLPGCQRSDAPPKPAGSSETTETTSTPEPGDRVIALALSGLHCQACADTISRRLGKLDGVREARASFDAKTAWVTVEAGGPAIQQLIAAVEDAGYKASPAVNAAPATSRPTTAPSA